MADLLDAAGLSGGGSAQLALVVTPLMGLIKGTVGADFVVPCVDFEFDATLQTTQHVADADCQRMVWQAGRWVIGPGPEPATPPSVWAGHRPGDRRSATGTCAMTSPAAATAASAAGPASCRSRPSGWWRCRGVT